MQPFIKLDSKAVSDANEAPPAKNPKRVAAGRRNRQRRGLLTDAARERLRQAALKNQPWKQSTGPRTAAGKRISGRNWTRSNSFFRAISNTNKFRSSIVEPLREFVRALHEFRTEMWNQTPPH